MLIQQLLVALIRLPYENSALCYRLKIYTSHLASLG
jgi:hypothetical protein